MIGAGLLADDLHRARANAPWRHVYHALKGGVRVSVGHQPQIRKRVFDFGAFKKSKPAVHAVGNALREQQLFKHARLRVGAVQNADAVAAPAKGLPGLNAVDDKAPFVELIKRAVYADWLAVLALRPEVFAHAVGVEINDGVGGF